MANDLICSIVDVDADFGYSLRFCILLYAFIFETRCLQRAPLLQIISPHDKGISQCIMDNLEPWESSWDEELHKLSSLCIDPLCEVQESYMKDIQQHCHFRYENLSCLTRTMQYGDI